MELISHHLCPFLHRSIILLEKKGLKRNHDFKVTYVPIYDLPKWMFELSPKGSMPILRLDDGRILLRSIAINAYLDETIQPSFLPIDAYERAQHRAFILTCGDLLDLIRNVYTAKEETTMNMATDKIFNALKDTANDVHLLSIKQGQDDAQMAESGFAALFTLMLQFDVLSQHPRWDEIKDVRSYADVLVSDPIVQASKCPDYQSEFNHFFDYVGSAFRLVV
jgi:glutathione S-transferase